MVSGSPGVVPGCSGAYTVKCGASASRNGPPVRPQGPWKKTAAGPAPWTWTRIGTRPCQTTAVCVVIAPASWMTGLAWRAGGLPAAAQALRPPVVLPALVIPDLAQPGQHLAREEIDVLERQLVRHRADLHQHHQVADVETLDDLLDQTPLDGGRAARDHVALLHEVLVAPRLGIFGSAHRVAVGRQQAAVVLVARRREPLPRHVQALVVEVLDVLRVVVFRLRVGL